MAMIETDRPEPKPIGRPSSFDQRFTAMAHRMALLGATMEEMAAAFGVTRKCVDDWMHSKPEFRDAIMRGRSEADAHIAESLYHRAKGARVKTAKPVTLRDASGMTYTSVVEYEEGYPPDTMAASLWLRNRRPDLWRDKQEHDVTVTGKLARLDDEERAARALELVRGMLGNDQAPAIEGTMIDVTPATDDTAK